MTQLSVMMSIWAPELTGVIIHFSKNLSKFQANDIYDLAKIIGDARGKQVNFDRFHHTMMMIIVLYCK